MTSMGYMHCQLKAAQIRVFPIFTRDPNICELPRIHMTRSSQDRFGNLSRSDFLHSGTS